jgi:hypothetical protein
MSPNAGMWPRVNRKRAPGIVIAEAAQRADSGAFVGRSIQRLDAQVAELVGLSFFAVVLDTYRAGGILVVDDVGSGDTIDFDLDARTLAGDAVSVPLVTFEGIARALFEFRLACGIALDRADEPHSPGFVVESAGPGALGVAIDFALITEDFVRLDVGAEHESAVSLAFRQ